MKPPMGVRQTRGIMGTVSLYRLFCPHVSEIALALIALTKKHAGCVWSPEYQQVFDKLKQLLSKSRPHKYFLIPYGSIHSMLALVKVVLGLC